jgi:hypothetical protein
MSRILLVCPSLLVFRFSYFLHLDIFNSFVPKAERENYRIMRNITISLNRAGIKLIMELNSELLTRILENILEVSTTRFSSECSPQFFFVDESYFWLKIRVISDSHMILVSYLVAVSHKFNIPDLLQYFIFINIFSL